MLQIYRDVAVAAARRTEGRPQLRGGESSCTVCNDSSTWSTFHHRPGRDCWETKGLQTDHGGRGLTWAGDVDTV